MTISKELILAILSMDSYDRGYDAGLSDGGPDDIDGLGGVGSFVGIAKVIQQSVVLAGSDSVNAGFYAVAYELTEAVGDMAAGTVIISYRGTDGGIVGELLPDTIPIIAGDYDEDQIYLANQFYNSVKAANSDANITLTGHSLGGGLAGFVAALHGENAVIVDHIDFDDAVNNFKADLEFYNLYIDDLQGYQALLAHERRITFAEMEQRLASLGISADDALSYDFSNITSSYLSGSIAAPFRGDDIPTSVVLPTILP